MKERKQNDKFSRNKLGERKKNTKRQKERKKE